MIVTTLIFVSVLSLLVFVHEFGHFITAKRAGIRVDEFGFGFPPRAFGVKRGETIYSINWVPLGGFVRIKGEAGEHSKDKDSFANKRAPTRALVLLAGVIMNVILGWALLTVGYVIGLPQVVEDLSSYARVGEPKIQVMQVLPGSPAERAGIEAGDEIVSVGGQTATDAEQVRAVAESRLGSPTDVYIVRDGKHVTKQVIPVVLKESGKPGMGVALLKTGIVSYPFYIAPLEAAHSTWLLAKEIVLSFYDLLHGLFVERKVTVEFSGPVGIAVLTGQVAALGFRHLLQFTALLSINLAIINVLPFPALDGGRMLFLVIEAVRGRAVSRRIEVMAHNLGFALLMTLVVFVTYRDVVRYGGGIGKAISSLFGG
jgi:regulator of sigma E protease